MFARCSTTWNLNSSTFKQPNFLGNRELRKTQRTYVLCNVGKELCEGSYENKRWKLFHCDLVCLVEKVRVNVKLPPSNFNTDLTFAGREAFFKFRTEVNYRKLSEI